MMAHDDGNPLRLAPTPADEREVLVRLDDATQTAYITSCWPSRTKRLQKTYGPPDRLSTRNGLVTAAFWHVPLRCITFRSAPPKHPGNIRALKRARAARKKR